MQKRIKVIPDVEVPELAGKLMFACGRKDWNAIEEMIDNGEIPEWTFSLFTYFPMWLFEKLISHEEVHKYFTNQADQYKARQDIMDLLQERGIVEGFVQSNPEDYEYIISADGNFVDGKTEHFLSSDGYFIRTYNNFTNNFGEEGSVSRGVFQIRNTLNITADVLHLNDAKFLCRGNIYVNVKELQCEPIGKIKSYPSGSGPIFMREDVIIGEECIIFGEVIYYNFE